MKKEVQACNQKILYLPKITEIILTTIEGIYENEQVIFKEKPPIQVKTKVLLE